MLTLSEGSRAFLTNAIAKRLAGGTAELLATNRHVLARFVLPLLTSMQVVANRIKILDIQPVEAIESGTAESLKVYDSSGADVLQGDVGLLESTAFFKINDPKILKGGEISLQEVVLELTII